MRRVCFLFNHDQIHQMAHSLPVALRMVELAGVEVTLAFANDQLENHARLIAGNAFSRFRVERLALASASSRFVAAALERWVPARKIALYRDNLDFFRGFDALVVSEKTSLLLKTRYGLDKLRIIHTGHGAGDRALGFSRAGANFDLMVVAGPKGARRHVRDGGVDPSRIRIIGYPKFDLYAERQIPSPFPDRRPIVLYAPHPSPKLSSYYLMGKRVVEAVARSGRFNLIFAPHIMLMQRRWTVTVAPPALARVPQPEAKVLASPHVLFDPGSPASADMSYTNLADIYVGDVSSQVYEFLLHPRPCLHLNAHGVEWQGDPNFAHWQSGPVLEREEDVLAALDAAIDTFPQYRSAQEALLADTFDITAEPAGLRGARAILEYLDGT